MKEKVRMVKLVEKKTRQELIGVVVSDACDKTITVLVETYKKDAKYDI